MNLEFHELANIFPLLEGKDFDELVEDVRQNGLQFPIIIHEDKILDGRNRYRAACKIAEDEDEPETYYYFTEPYIGEDPMQYVMSLNLHRRHLTESQRAMIAVDMTDSYKDDKKVGEQMNVGARTIQMARAVKKDGIDELQEKVESGKVSLSAAEKVSQLPATRQKKVVKNNAEKAVSKNMRKKKNKLSTEKPARTHTEEPYDLFTVEIAMCEFCLNGEGGYCQSPGCGLYKRQSPDFALDQFEIVSKSTVSD